MGAPLHENDTEKYPNQIKDKFYLSCAGKVCFLLCSLLHEVSASMKKRLALEMSSES